MGEISKTFSVRFLTSRIKERNEKAGRSNNVRVSKRATGHSKVKYSVLLQDVTSEKEKSKERPKEEHLKTAGRRKKSKLTKTIGISNEPNFGQKRQRIGRGVSLNRGTLSTTWVWGGRGEKKREGSILQSPKGGKKKEMGKENEEV